MKLLPGVARGEIEDFVRTVVLSIRAWGGVTKNGLRGKNWKKHFLANG